MNKEFDRVENLFYLEIMKGVKGELINTGTVQINPDLIKTAMELIANNPDLALTNHKKEFMDAVFDYQPRHIVHGWPPRYVGDSTDSDFPF